MYLIEFVERIEIIGTCETYIQNRTVISTPGTECSIVKVTEWISKYILSSFRDNCITNHHLSLHQVW